jgi:hypothetical protein
MQFVSSRLLLILIAATLAVAAPLPAQQAPENFRWVDFHSAKDQSVVAWVTRSLEPEKLTAIREIGVEYDAALVITTQRATPQSAPSSDTFTVWNLSLTSHVVAPLLKGTNLRLLDWILLADGRPRELAAMYDDCTECNATTYFTAFHYDMKYHMWASRWMRGAQAAPIWSTNPVPGVDLTQLYALLAEPDARQFMATWNHIDHGEEKPEDSLFRYDLDPYSGLERTALVSGKDAQTQMQRICNAQGASPGLARGQDSELCQQSQKPRPTRKPNTRPPANNYGRSTPPAARR